MKEFFRELLRPKTLAALVLLVICPLVFANGIYAWFSSKGAEPVVSVDAQGLQNAIPFGAFSGAGDNAVQVEVTADNVKKSWYPGETMEITLTITNPNDMPIVFRIAKMADANGIFKDDFGAENVFTNPDDPNNILNSIFAKMKSLTVGTSYFGQLQGKSECNVKVAMTLEGENFVYDENTAPNIENAIRIDACQSDKFAVKDYFDLDVTVDVNGVLSVDSKGEAE